MTTPTSSCNSCNINRPQTAPVTSSSSSSTAAAFSSHIKEGEQQVAGGEHEEAADTTAITDFGKLFGNGAVIWFVFFNKR